MDLSDRQRKLLFVALVLALAAVGVYLTVAKPDNTTERTSPRSNPTVAAPSAPATPATPPPGIGSAVTPETFDIYRLLPFPRKDFAIAADLAQRFTAAYGTYRFDESPQAYIQRLTSMTADDLGAELARGASAPGLQEQRQQDQVIAESTATLDSVRDIEANSIIFVVTSRQQLTKAGKKSQVSKQFAVTIARDGAALRVYAFEPADAGQPGDTE